MKPCVCVGETANARDIEALVAAVTSQHSEVFAAVHLPCEESLGFSHLLLLPLVVVLIL